VAASDVPRVSTFRTRRRRDRIIAAAIAVVVIVAATVVYLTSDIRATDSQVAPAGPAPEEMTSVPQRLQVDWQQATDSTVGAVASPFGTVVTSDQHTVTGRDVGTGAVRWSYSRSDRQLCRIGSGDTTAGELQPPFSTQSDGAARGIMAIYARDGLCGEMVLLDPRTGERRYQRTAPNQPDGSLIYGGPYAAWVGPNRMEIWRWDLLRTFQYGNQPNPTSSNTRHLGCTFTDAAVTDNQFGTIEHCPAKGKNARIVLNWTDPNTHDNDKYDVYKTDNLMDVDTGSTAARIVGITKDRVAVLVAAPTPAVLVYDAAGKIAGRTPVDVPATAIGSTVGPTPRITLSDVQYALVGDRLIATGSEQVTVTVPISTSSTTSETSTSTVGPGTLLGGSVTGGSTAEPTSKTEGRASPTLRWTLPKAIGLPTAIGTNLLVPTAGGLLVVPAAEGTVSRTVAVPRAGNPPRVDVMAVGAHLVELRSDEVVSLTAGR